MNKKLVPIIAVVLVVVVGVAAYFLVFRKTDEEPKEVITYYPLADSFITNVSESGKLLKSTMVLVANTDTLQETIDASQYLIRNEILFILRSLTEEDVRNSEIETILGTRIVESLNEALEIDNFTSVLFSDFVMQ